MTDDTATRFDPSRYLTLVSGKEYLEVKFRILWLRTVHPDAIIDTELITHENNYAVFKAYVKIPDGGSATGWGDEDKQGFTDYLTKAETKAIGRALAALGFGTQFSYDHDYSGPSGRVVDAPVQPRQIGGNAPQQVNYAPQRASGGYDTAATERQMSLIASIARDLKMSRQDLDATAQEVTGAPFDGLSRRNASTLIESLKERTTRGVPV